MKWYYVTYSKKLYNEYKTTLKECKSFFLTEKKKLSPSFCINYIISYSKSLCMELYN